MGLVKDLFKAIYCGILHKRAEDESTFLTFPLPSRGLTFVLLS